MLSNLNNNIQIISKGMFFILTGMTKRSLFVIKCYIKIKIKLHLFLDSFHLNTQINL